MTCTVRGYPSLQNYKDEVEKNPDALRPDCCPECKQPKLWLHGFYNRLIIRKDAVVIHVILGLIFHDIWVTKQYKSRNYGI